MGHLTSGCVSIVAHGQGHESQLPLAASASHLWWRSPAPLARGSQASSQSRNDARNAAHAQATKCAKANVTCTAPPQERMTSSTWASAQQHTNKDSHTQVKYWNAAVSVARAVYESSIATAQRTRCSVWSRARPQMAARLPEPSARRWRRRKRRSAGRPQTPAGSPEPRRSPGIAVAAAAACLAQGTRASGVRTVPSLEFGGRQIEFGFFPREKKRGQPL